MTKQKVVKVEQVEKIKKAKTAKSKTGSGQARMTKTLDPRLSRDNKEPRTMDELLKQTGYQLHGFKRGETVEGKIVTLKSSEILIDIGAKSLAVVSKKEEQIVKNLVKTAKIGDKILVQLISPESEAGQIIVSIRKAGFEKKWQDLEEKKNQAVEVLVVEAIKAGLLVECEGLRGFIPSSQLDNASGLPQSKVGQKLKVIIIEVDKANDRLIFSEKRVISPLKLAEKKKLLAGIKINETYDGKISGIVAFGVFVSLENGTEGLVHISEIAWEKVGFPGDYFKVGDKVKVVVIGKEEETGKLNLSIKQLTEDSWIDAAKQYSLEQVVTGKISQVTGYGVLVELEAGIDGLIHSSKIPAGTELKKGDKITCIITRIDPKRRQISLDLILKEKPMGYK